MKTIKKMLCICLMLLSYHISFAQLTLEPAITLKPLSNIFGIGDFGLSNLTNLPLNNKFSVASYTAISNRFYQVGLEGGNENTDINYRVELKQLFGAGVHFNRAKSVHSIYALGGLGWISFKEELNNSELDLQQSYQASHFDKRLSLLYSWKRTVKEDMNFTLRTYLPFVTFEGIRPDFIEMTVELGLVFNL